MPSTPPSVASSRLSVSSCRIRRGLVAPSESRTDSSFCRGRPRQEQIRDVGADDQQDQRHDDAQDGRGSYLVVLDVIDAAPARLSEQPWNFPAVSIDEMERSASGSDCMYESRPARAVC